MHLGNFGTTTDAREDRVSDTKPHVVYLVTSGKYSDYRVLAIFSTLDLAGRYVSAITGTDQCDSINDIEEYPLDGPRDNLPGAWLLDIDESGEIVMEPFWSMYEGIGAPEAFTDEAGTRRFSGRGVTVEHARRSAEELRRQTLALEGKVAT